MAMMLRRALIHPLEDRDRALLEDVELASRIEEGCYRLLEHLDADGLSTCLGWLTADLEDLKTRAGSYTHGRLPLPAFAAEILALVDGSTERLSRDVGEAG